MSPSPFAAYDYLTDAVCVLDLERRIVYANPIMDEFWGGGRSVLGLTCYELCHSSCPCGCGCLDPSHCVFELVFDRGRPATAIHDRVMRDGSHRNCEVTASPVRDKAGNIVHVVQVVRDVSEQEAAKRQLEKNARLDAAVAALSRAVMAGGDIAEVARQVMAQAQRLTDSRQAFVGSLAPDGHLALSAASADPWQVAAAVGEPDPAKSGHDLYGWVRQTGEAVLSNDPVAPRSGGDPPGHSPVRRFLSVPVRGEEALLGQIAVANAERDYSAEDQRLLERLAEIFALSLQHHDNDQKILHAKQEWERTFESIGDIICILDPGLRIVKINQAGASLFDKAPAELVGSSCYGLFHGGEGPCGGCPIEQVWRDPDTYFAVIEHKKLNKTFEVTISPIFTDQGAISGYVHFAKDITELKKLELQLREAMKMEAVGRLAGGVAHDFNNILTIITGYLSIALRQISHDESPIREALNQVDKASRRAANLVRQLLLFSRRQPMHFMAVDLNHSLQELLKMLRRFIGENVQLDLRLGDGLWPIEGDAGSIDQIVMNLAVNARDAMPDGGTLTIETQNVELDATGACAGLHTAPGRYVLITVTDTGCGMDHDTIQHIYEPFFTTKAADKGTGLGLAVVYGIVVEHRGWISCSSKQGQGASFQIYLPAAKAKDCDGQDCGPLDPASLMGHGERVLVVEDDDTILQYAEMVLLGNGYRVSTATSLGAAMEVVEREAEAVDVLFSDVVLADGYGPELARRLVDQRPELGIAMTTGYPERYGEWPEGQEGAWAFVQKPYDAQSLLVTIRQALSRARQK